MPYRPLPALRKNIRGVIYPLTEAIRRKYGTRESDGAYPLGSFYPINVSNKVWIPAGGIWFVPSDSVKIEERVVNELVVQCFMESIEFGAPIELPSGTVVEWERIPSSEADQLPA